MVIYLIFIYCFYSVLFYLCLLLFYFSLFLKSISSIFENRRLIMLLYAIAVFNFVFLFIPFVILTRIYFLLPFFNLLGSSIFSSLVDIFEFFFCVEFCFYVYKSIFFYFCLNQVSSYIMYVYCYRSSTILVLTLPVFV